MPILTQVGAMVIRGCGAVLGKVVGVRTFCTIRGASGPIRYNPHAPGTAKPTRLESREETGIGISHSRPVQRWKCAPKTDEEWGLRKLQEQKRYWDRQEEAGTEAEKDQSFASAEMKRLKTEMKLRDSSIQSSAPFSHKFEGIHPVAEEEQGLSSNEISPSRTKHGEQDAPSLSSRPKLSRAQEAVALTAELGTIPAVKKKQTLGSGLFYGDGRKFEGLLPDANDLFDDSLGASEDKLFETPETEEDKDIVKEKQSAKNYALRLLGIAPQTAHKLRQKLIGRNVSASVIESTIADLQRCGLQSDLEYAEILARSRWRSSLWGPQRIKQELRLRGVSLDDIGTAVQKVFTSNDDLLDQGEDSEDNEGRWGMTKEASDHLLEKARFQWGRGGSISAEARKRRMIGWLQRRGFNWSVTSQILKSLESQDREIG